jgi:3',5'-cyclic AMP phosphodiesterase CpdA
MKNIRGRHLFRFALIADSHLNPVDEGNTSPWQTNHLANPRNEVVVDAINLLKPAFTVHLGDVVHPLPYTSSYKGAAEFANNLYLRLNNALYIAPGNHDIGDKCLPGNPAATISEESCKTYEGYFGDQWQSFERDGICFVILNSCLFGSGSEMEDQQWNWFEKTLSKNSDKRIILFSHYPPFITDRNEENNYDNV